MNIETVVIGDFQTNAYVVYSDSAHAAIVIDCPGPADPLLSFLDSNKLSPELLVMTHAHIDHIGGITQLQAAYPSMKTAAGEEASEMLSRPSMNLSIHFGHPLKFSPPDITLADEQTLVAAGFSFKVRIVNGHAPGSVCLVHDAPPPVVFTGDTLFAGSVGRSDLPGGDTNTLIAKIQERIMTLSEETAVYPGHGPKTTIGNEKSNPFLAKQL